jgi:hypothetical protein
MPLARSGQTDQEWILLESINSLASQISECHEVDQHRAAEHIDGLRDLIQALPTKRSQRREQSDTSGQPPGRN